MDELFPYILFGYVWSPGVFALMGLFLFRRVQKRSARVYVATQILFFMIVQSFWIYCWICMLVVPTFVGNGNVYFFVRYGVVVIAWLFFGLFVRKGGKRWFIMQEIPKVILVLDQIYCLFFGRYVGP